MVYGLTGPTCLGLARLWSEEDGAGVPTDGLAVHRGVLTLVLVPGLGRQGRPGAGWCPPLCAGSSWLWASPQHGGPKSKHFKRQEVEEAKTQSPDPGPASLPGVLCRAAQDQGEGTQTSPLGGSDIRVFVVFLLPQPPSASVRLGPDAHQRLLSPLSLQVAWEAGAVRCSRLQTRR